MFPNKYFNLRFFAGRYFPPNADVVKKRGTGGKPQGHYKKEEKEKYNNDALIVLLADMA